MATTFQRAALYEEVWSEPLVALARKYGLSDNGLRKICMAMNIPVPTVGYWAKLAAGYSVARTALPPRAARTSYTANPPPAQASAFHTAEDDAWLAQRDEYERRADCLIQVTEHPTHWHAVASMLQRRIEERLREVQRSRQAAERAEKRSLRERQRTPEFESADWRMFVRDGQLLMHAPLRVTPQGYERALRIANAVCFAAEKRGFAVTLTEDFTRIQLSGHGAKVRLRIAEKLDEKVIREPAYSGGLLENKKTKVPTGILRHSRTQTLRWNARSPPTTRKGSSSPNRTASSRASIAWSFAAASGSANGRTGIADGRWKRLDAKPTHGAKRWRESVEPSFIVKSASGDEPKLSVRT